MNTALIISSLALAQMSSPTIQPIEYEGRQIYRTSHALLVADDALPQGEPAFGQSTQALYRLLTRDCGFPASNVTLLSSSLKNLTLSNIRHEISKLKDTKRVSNQDRVLIVFAMHGSVIGNKGYFLCERTNNSAKPELLPMDEITNAILSRSGIQGKHVLMLADSCSVHVSKAIDPVTNSFSINKSKQLQLPYRAVWSASDPTSTTITVDANQSTNLIGGIVTALSYSLNYKEKIATDSTISEGLVSENGVPLKHYIREFYSNYRGGSFVFALEPKAMSVKDEDAARSQMRLDEARRARDLTTAQRDNLVEAESRLRDLQNSKPVDEIALANAKALVGEKYIDISYGYEGENMQAAIKKFTEALDVLTEQTDPKDWAAVETNLGIAYQRLPVGDIENNLNTAIGCYQAALRVDTQKANPQEWAKIRNNIGLAYLNLPHGQHIEEAILCFKDALNIWTRENDRINWAKVNINLGNAYEKRSNGNKIDNIHNAVSCFTDALSALSDKSDAVLWAQTQINLGNIYLHMSSDRSFNIGEAIKCFDNALHVYTKNEFPQAWALTQILEGEANRDLPGNLTKNPGKAIDCFRLALQVYKKNDYSQMWALIQTDLGDLFQNLPEGSVFGSNSDAITHYKLALNVYSKEKSPQDWARVNNDLGLAYQNLTVGTRSDNIENAIRAYKCSLEVYSEKENADSWARVERNLGSAYSVRMVGERSENQNCVIACYTNALRIPIENVYPQEWAIAQRNMGIAYMLLFQMNKGNDMEKAIACFNATLNVWNEKNAPDYFAQNQYNLGLAYHAIKDDVHSIECFKKATKIAHSKSIKAMAQTALDQLK